MSPDRPLALVAAVVLALTGCATPFGGDEDPSASPTSSQPPSTTGASSTSSPSPTTTSDLGRAERELSEAEATKMLPTKPKGYSTADVDNGSRWRRTDPEVCADLLRMGWQGRRAHGQRTARATADWDINQDDTKTYQAYTVRIDSHSQPVRPGLLGRAGDALGQCGAFAFTGTNSGGSFDERVLAEVLPVRTIGEQTFAVRLTTFVEVGGRTHTLYADQLSFRVGRNLVSVSSTNYRENSSTEELETLADDTLESLRR